MALTDLDLQLRLAMFALAHVAVFAWARYIVAPGSPGKNRVLRALPVVPVVLLVPCLFEGQDPDEAFFALIANANFLWLVPSGIWCLAMNRGQLVKSYDCGRTGAFALGLLATVTLAFEEKPVAKDKIDESKGKHAYKDVRFNIIQFKGRAFFMEAANIAGCLLAKVALMYVMRKGYYFFRESGHYFWADVCLGWTFYGTTAYTQDLYSFIILLTMNMKLAPNFNNPFLSQSMQELWSKRYNLVMGEALRDLIYDPICEGRWVRGSTYRPARSTSAMRKAIAVLLTFAVSGIIHVFMLWHAIRTRVPVLCGLFFVACGLVVIAENAVKDLLKASGYLEFVDRMVPSFVRVLYTLGTLFVLTHLLFWPDMHAAGVANLAADLIMHTLKLT